MLAGRCAAPASAIVVTCERHVAGTAAAASAPCGRSERCSARAARAGSICRRASPLPPHDMRATRVRWCRAPAEMASWRRDRLHCGRALFWARRAPPARRDRASHPKRGRKPDPGILRRPRFRPRARPGAHLRAAPPPAATLHSQTARCDTGKSSWVLQCGRAPARPPARERPSARAPVRGTRAQRLQC